MSKKLAIVGIFYSGYTDLWTDFINLLNKNWPNRSYDFYIVCDNGINAAKTINDKSVVIIDAGKNAEYSKKVQLAIDKIDSDYFLLLLEDFFISKKVDENQVFQLFETVKTYGIDYLSMPIPSFVAKKERQLPGHPFLCSVSGKTTYIYNCQPAIWNKKFLKMIIGDCNYNAWVFEGIYSHCDFIRNKRYLRSSFVDYRNVLNIAHGAVQGKILPSTYKALKKNGYVLTTKRSILSFFRYAFYRFKHFANCCMYFFHLSFLRKIFYKKTVINKYQKEIIATSNSVINKQSFDDYFPEL